MNGMTYDEEGAYVGAWWSNDTLLEYNKRIDCFIKQYSNYYIDEIGVYVKGDITLNENLADNGGLKEAYKAFKKLIDKSEELIAVKDYSLEQLFFIGYGTVSCIKIQFKIFQMKFFRCGA